MQLRISTGLTDELLDELRAGRHDLVISTRRPNSRGLVSEPFADEEFVLVAAPGWAERLKNTEGRPNAAGRRWPTCRSSPTTPTCRSVRRYWRYVFNERLTAPARLTTIPDLRGIRTAVVAGAGWTVLPKYLCRAELDSGSLTLLHRARRGTAEHRVPRAPARRVGESARGAGAARVAGGREGVVGPSADRGAGRLDPC